MTSFAPRFGRREVPLAATAVYAEGDAALALGRRLLQRLPVDDPPRVLGSVGAARWLLLVGAALPWVDGAIWLGRDPGAPGLLLPTRSGPDMHPRLIEQALADRFVDLEPPLAVLPDQRLVLPAGRALPADADLLARWLGA